MSKNEIVNRITANECQSLGQGTGLRVEDGKKNCEILQGQLMKGLAEQLDAIRNGHMVIQANEDSKCSPNDDPTIASILSHLLRISEAYACILCKVDPVLNKLLTSGKYPQVLMGGGESGDYPLWIDPATSVDSGNLTPVTSNAVYQAVKQAILGVWHYWTDFDYFVEDIQGLNKLREMSNGDNALVVVGAGGKNQEYVYDGNDWLANDAHDNLESFSVIQINKGKWAGAQLYYFVNEGNSEWAELNASDDGVMGELRKVQLEARQSITGMNNEKYELVVVDSIADAKAIEPKSGVTIIAIIDEKS